MPELIEIEQYRRLAESRALDRTISAVIAGDAWYLKRGLVAAAVTAALTGRRLTAARRRGKLLLLDIGPGGGVLGLRFGMSGRLVVDGQAPIGRLLYAPAGDAARFHRFAVTFADSGTMTMSDPRRLGGVELDPDESRLGPDGLALTLPELSAALAGSSVPLKARLLDQHQVAGIGNLLADEILWRAALAPGRPAREVTTAERRRLHQCLVATLNDLLERGGSHLGDLMPERRRDGHCPRDGRALARSTVGGRTTYWCPAHQR